MKWSRSKSILQFIQIYISILKNIESDIMSQQNSAKAKAGNRGGPIIIIDDDDDDDDDKSS